MSDSSPDTTSSSAFLYSTTIVIAILFVAVTIIFFRSFSYLSFFQLLLWFILPICIYIIASFLNLAGQQISCKKVNAGKAFRNSLLVLGPVYLALIIATIPYARIPIGSLFAPLFEPKLANTMSLIPLEVRHPTLKGISYAYYIFWGILFGQIMNGNFSAACSTK